MLIHLSAAAWAGTRKSLSVAEFRKFRSVCLHPRPAAKCRGCVVREVHFTRARPRHGNRDPCRTRRGVAEGRGVCRRRSMHSWRYARFHRLKTSMVPVGTIRRRTVHQSSRAMIPDQGATGDASPLLASAETC